MELEQKKENTEWYSLNKIRFRVCLQNQGASIIWVSNEFKDVIFSLITYDFISRCKDELNLDIGIDSSWQNHWGLLVDTNDVRLILGEIVYFLSDWNISPSTETFTQEEWYK